MKDLFWRRVGDRRVWPEVVVPALETRQGSAEGNVVERDDLVGKAFFLEGSAEQSDLGVEAITLGG
jgi:hypothetical protein